MRVEFSGSCLCGAVQFESRSAPLTVGHCHCEDCRKSSGTGHCTHMAVPAAAFAVTGTPMSFDKPANSGNMVTRNFCGTCGSPLFSTNAAMPDLVFPRASVLQDPDKYAPQLTVWSKRAVVFDPVDAALPQFETEIPPEVMAEMMG